MPILLLAYVKINQSRVGSKTLGVYDEGDVGLEVSSALEILAGQYLVSHKDSQEWRTRFQTT